MTTNSKSTESKEMPTPPVTTENEVDDLGYTTLKRRHY